MSGKTNKERNRNKSNYRSDDRSKKSADKKGSRMTQDSFQNYANCKGDGKSGNISSLNDFSWYNKYPQLIQSAASLPFPKRPGQSITLGSITSGSSTAVYDKTIPGVWKINFIPSVGFSNTNMSPASIAARELYARVRNAFSGTLPEDAPDILIYLMALDSIFSALGFVKRAYRALTAYSPMNYSVPDRLLNAMGMSDTDIATAYANRMDFWGGINQLILKSRKFTCPEVMDIFKRHYWMNDNVYLDRPSVMSQMYLFVQQQFYKFDETSSTDGGQLALVYLDSAGGSTTPKYQKWLLTIDQMLDALAASEDAYTINGHLMRAFEGTPNFIVEDLPQQEELIFSYVPEVLMQIMNIHSLPTLPQLSGTNISQDPNTNAIIHQPVITNSTFKPLNPKLNLFSDAPTPADVVLASRLHAVFDGASGSASYRIKAGTEIVLDMGIYTTQNAVDNQILTTDMQYTTGAITASTFVPYFNTACDVAAFEAHPILDFVLMTGSNQYNVNTLMQTHNVNTFKWEDIANIHEKCIYSEFNAFSI